MTYTRARRKAYKGECPKCKRQIAYTQPYLHLHMSLRSDTIVFYNHKNEEGEPCE